MSVCIKSLIQNMNLVIGCTNHCPYCYARNNVRRFHMVEDFAVPQFFEGKLRLMDNQKAGTYLLTGMSDLADWQPDWLDKVLQKAAENPQNTFLFLTKSPERLNITTELDNLWFGTTVTRRSELHRLTTLRQTVRAKHYHATFEPLFEALGELPLDGYEWVVPGTETGRRKGKVDARPEWVLDIAAQAQARGIPVFMKEDLLPIMGEEAMTQQLPPSFPIKRRASC